MISYYNKNKEKRPSFGEIQGRIVLVSDGSRLGLSGSVFLVTEDDGRAVIGREVERSYSEMLKRFTYSQNKELGDGKRIDRSAIRVACDTVAEVDAVREAVRVMEANIWAETKTAERRLAALEGASINSTGPVVLKEFLSPEGRKVPNWTDAKTGEIVHALKEVSE